MTSLLNSIQDFFFISEKLLNDATVVGAGMVCHTDSLSAALVSKLDYRTANKTAEGKNLHMAIVSGKSTQSDHHQNLFPKWTFYTFLTHFSSAFKLSAFYFHIRVQSQIRQNGD